MHTRKRPGCSILGRTFDEIPVITISHRFGPCSSDNKYKHLLDLD